MVFNDIHCVGIICGAENIRNGIDHVKSHFHGTCRMVGPRLGQTRHAVVAVAQDLDAQAMVVLMIYISLILIYKKKINSFSLFFTHISQLIETPKQLVQQPDQLLGTALRSEHRESHDIRKENTTNIPETLLTLPTLH